MNTWILRIIVHLSKIGAKRIVPVRYRSRPELWFAVVNTGFCFTPVSITQSKQMLGRFPQKFLGNLDSSGRCIAAAFDSVGQRLGKLNSCQFRLGIKPFNTISVGKESYLPIRRERIEAFLDYLGN